MSSPSSSSSSPLYTRLTTSLESRASRKILRSLALLPPSLTQTNNTSPLIDFSSNDYLSFSRSPLLRHKLLSGLTELPPSISPFGPSSSRLLDGNSPLHLSLERQLSSFLHAPTALIFNSGWDANVGLWSVLPGKEDYVIYDELIHASTHDGMRQSRLPLSHRLSFSHNNLISLRSILEKLVSEEEGVREGRRGVWVAVESLYSMDGDLCPLREVVELVEEVLKKGNGHLVVDEVKTSTSSLPVPLFPFPVTQSLFLCSLFFPCNYREISLSSHLKGPFNRSVRTLRKRNRLCPRTGRQDRSEGAYFRKVDRL